MMKAEKMVRLNRAASREKVSRALREIDRMLEDEELVTIAELVERTGLSRAFFYNNQEVHQAVERARDLQQGRKFVKPQQVILNQAMEQQILMLKKHLGDLQEENAGLMKELEELREENMDLQMEIDSLRVENENLKEDSWQRDEKNGSQWIKKSF